MSTGNHRPDLFEHTLRTMDFGQTPAELSDAFAELLQAVKDTGKQGSVSLKLTVKPESLQSGQVSITPEIKAACPQLPREKAMMFVTPDNNTQREDPRQKKLQFDAVDGGKTGTQVEAEHSDKPQAFAQS